MINKQLEINVNDERLLEKLAENLNINYITDGSNLKKIADVYSVEKLNYSNSVDDAISNGFLSTMSSEFLELFGRQNNIYRKNYSNIAVYKYQEAVELSVNKESAMVSEITQEYTLYKKSELIYTDDNIIVECLEDIVLKDINDVLNISVRITLALSLGQFTIQEGSEFIVTSPNSRLSNLLPFFTLRFKKPVGLAVLQEYEEDYKLRVYESTYLANNGANSLVSAITKEVPFIYFIETNDYKEGRSIKAIYPYTQELVDNGYDDFIDNLIVPLVETNLRGKTLHGSLIEVLKPEPLLLNIEIDLKNGNKITDSYLDNTRLSFNRFFCTYKNINRSILESFIKNELALQDETIIDIKFIFTSPYVSEETFTIENEPLSNIEIPIGRFLHLNSITQ